MTVERFLEVLNLIETVEENYDTQRTLESIASNLTALVNSPGQPTQQTALAAGLTRLNQAVAELDQHLNPADIEAISKMGGKSFFDRDLAQEVSDSVSRNAMTPSVAREFVQELSNNRKEFLDNVHAATISLKNLDVTPTNLAPGTADVSFLIPRELFDNELDSFSKELRFISKLFADYSEAITGSREQVKLEGLSSSVPTIVLVAALPVLSKVADVTNKFLDAWKKVEEIREVRARVEALGVKGAAYDEFTKKITETIDGVVDQAVKSTIENYEGEKTRKHELTTALKQGTKRLFGQIELGLTVRFRASIDEEESTEEQKELESLSELGKSMEFPEPSKSPLLLSHGQLIDDEVNGESVQPTKTVPSKAGATKKSVK